MIHPRAAQSCALHPTDNQYTHSCIPNIDDDTGYVPISHDFK